MSLTIISKVEEESIVIVQSWLVRSRAEDLEGKGGLRLPQTDELVLLDEVGGLDGEQAILFACNAERIAMNENERRANAHTE